MLKAVVIVLAALTGMVMIATALMFLGFAYVFTTEPSPTPVLTPTPFAASPTPTSTPEPSPVLECKNIETEVNGDIYIQVGADGHRILLCDNPEAADVDWSELVEFLGEDRTDEIPYLEGVFVCADYAEMLHNNAEEDGIRAAWVGIDFYGSGTGHALNAFNTTDRGLVYIDVTNADVAPCSSDSVATVKVGEQIVAELIFHCAKWTLSMPGIVEQVSITW